MQYKKIIVYFLIIINCFYKFSCDYSFGMQENLKQDNTLKEFLNTIKKRVIDGIRIDYIRAEINKAIENGYDASFRKANIPSYDSLYSPLVFSETTLAQHISPIMAAIQNRKGLDFEFVRIRKNLFENKDNKHLNQTLIDISKDLILMQLQKIKTNIWDKMSEYEKAKKEEVFIDLEFGGIASSTKGTDDILRKYYNEYKNPKAGRAYPNQNHIKSINLATCKEIIKFLDNEIQYMEESSFSFNRMGDICVVNKNSKDKKTIYSLQPQKNISNKTPTVVKPLAEFMMSLPIKQTGNFPSMSQQQPRFQGDIINTKKQLQPPTQQQLQQQQQQDQTTLQKNSKTIIVLSIIAIVLVSILTIELILNNQKSQEEIPDYENRD